MAERTDELTRDGDDANVDGVSIDDADVADSGTDFDASALDTDFGVGGTASEETTTSTDASRVGRVKRRAGSVFSPSSFVLQLAGALLGVFVVGNLVPLVPLAGFVGLFLVAGLLGTLSSEPRYLEAGLAGGASGALAFFLDSMSLSVVTGGLLPALGAAVGLLVALGGFYAGRDVRDGVTRDL